jgi:hypothetical protein
MEEKPNLNRPPFLEMHVPRQKLIPVGRREIQRKFLADKVSNIQNLIAWIALSLPHWQVPLAHSLFSLL